MLCPSALCCWLSGLILFIVTATGIADELSQKDVAFFESKIRPILAKHCYECHSAGAKQVHGGLRLDSRHTLLQGGDSGAIVVAGQPEKSLLIESIGYSGDIQMPPAGKLPAAEIALLTGWVRSGAILPEDRSTSDSKKSIDFVAGRTFWSFVPPQAVPQPAVRGAEWLRQPIDSFVLTALETQNLTPTERADRRTLIRRATYDLTGLPPSAEEVAQFVADQQPDAYEQLIDRLLASPHYGERWGRYWLDYARYSDGNATSLEVRGQAWLYRDWVVGALSADLSYDQFVLQQFAADHLPECTSADLAALGFLGISPEYWKELQLAPAVIETIVADEWEERIDAIGRTFLGLSIACARCHDHKFDPISTEDYYALAGVLASTQLTERVVIPEPAAQVVRQATEKVKSLRAELAKLTAIQAKSPDDKAKIADLQSQIASIESTTPHYHSSTAHGLIDAALHVLPAGKNHTKIEYKPGETLDLSVHIRGNPTRRGAQVPRRFLTVFSADKPASFQQGSGRLELAKAILNEGAPLSARVIVNRVWKNHFGRGLVETLSDFGTQGARPSHPELLDDLTHRFVEHGWSLKWLHRELMLSATYQQGSTYSREKVGIDPDNRWLWRMNRRRLDIEAWRDSLLVASDNLDRRVGGPSVVLSAAANRRRTLYAKIDRADVDDVLRLFDFPDPATHSPDRMPTTTPLQQLFVLNSTFMQQQAQGVAELLLAGGIESKEAIVLRAYRQLFAREPSSNELRFGVEFLGEHATEVPRVREYAQALLGLNEFIFVD
ncbi:PSD1 and planctomycete cytochrome C domain-containing protein [Anatilimnocola aggregata]|nr:PSD1 and planctomycete cytochrome C domain-containing protein [Anatilimnocola aggregata]